MKKYGSALGPAARLTVWKVLGISLLAAGVHCLLFLTALNGWDVVNLGTPSLESVVWMGKLNRVFRVGLLLVCAVLALPWQERGTRTGYTLRRLSVNERVLVLLWGGLNALLLLIFWGVQTAVVLALSQHYLQTALADTASRQSLLIAFSRSPYLHALLPLWDWPVMLRNVLGCAALGLSAAALPFHWRHGRKSWTLLFLAVVAAVLFPAGMDSSISSAAGLLLFGSAITLMVSNIWRCYENEE